MSPTRRRPNIFSMLRYKAIKNTHIRCSAAAMLAVDALGVTDLELGPGDERRHHRTLYGSQA